MVHYLCSHILNMPMDETTFIKDMDIWESKYMTQAMQEPNVTRNLLLGITYLSGNNNSHDIVRNKIYY